MVIARRLHGVNAGCADVLDTELLKDSLADSSELDLGHHLDDAVVNLFFGVHLAILVGKGLTSLLNFLLLTSLFLLLVVVLFITFVVTCRRGLRETSVLGSDLGFFGEGSHAETDIDFFNWLCSAFGSRLLNNLAICIVFLLSNALLIVLFVLLRCSALLAGQRIRRVFQGRDLTC